MLIEPPRDYRGHFGLIYAANFLISFYLRAESFDSENVPDLLVKINGNNVFGALTPYVESKEDDSGTDKNSFMMMKHF